MVNWIPNGTVLKGESVELLPLEREHFDELVTLAKDKRIWEFYLIDGSNAEKLLDTLEGALNERKKGTHYPFVIWHKREKKLVGSTRFMEILPVHRKLEIGWTWLHPDYWATEINPECKLLLLTYCFETLKTIRVQLRTDENNIRSQKAMEKIGAKFEGILRHDMLRDNGTKRNSAYFSVIDTEWPEVKAHLMKFYEGKKAAK